MENRPKNLFNACVWQLLMSVSVMTLMACGGGATTPSVTDSLPPVTEKAPGKREKLIAALEELAATFASRDPQRVASLFPFPLPDTVLQVYTDEPAFIEVLEKSQGQLTRQIFVDYFPAISETVMMPDIDSLFKTLPPAQLGIRDTLEKTFIVPDQPCVKYYRLAVEGETVVLVAGITGNDQYAGNAEDSSSEMCETAAVWVFYFDGEKLVLKQAGVAG
jgi:hypothetical protein